MIAELTQLENELQRELSNILQYWILHTIDERYGGFYGKADNDNKIDIHAPKGLVLNARILWAFSAAYNQRSEKKYLLIAERAYQYLTDKFSDKQYGGFYWVIDKDGKIIDGKKQVYGIAFCLYGISEYYKASNSDIALQQAIACFDLIEKYSFDKNKGGYLEAFTRDWQIINDLRLSNKDANEKKTMNTHLHVLEAYTNLYKVWKDEKLRKAITLLLEIFIEYIIDKDTGHLHLFFNEDWQMKGNIVSYGHDIEAAWLLLDSAEAIEDEKLIEEIKKLSLKIATGAATGLDKDGGLWYETENGHLVTQKHWWAQAEAMVGFFNAWQISNDKKYLQYVLKNWLFIQQYILDKENGEWFWGINEDHSVMQGQDKAGFWKCPYHNSRACIEIIKRIQNKTH